MEESSANRRFHDVLEQTTHVVGRVRTVRVPRQLHLLHRREICEHLARKPRGFLFESLELGRPSFIGARERAQLAHTRDELDDRALEGENVGHDRGRISSKLVALSSRRY
jgi:hypothetical protein